jgi:hypothetical protein
MLFIKDKIKSSFPMKEDKKLLIITGAGASRSLMKDLPTGGELITGLKSYKNKSIAWLLGYCALRIFNQNNEDTYFHKGLAYLSQKLEKLFHDHPPSYKITEYKLLEETKKIQKLIESFYNGYLGGMIKYQKTPDKCPQDRWSTKDFQPRWSLPNEDMVTELIAEFKFFVAEEIFRSLNLDNLIQHLIHLPFLQEDLRTMVDQYLSKWDIPETVKRAIETFKAKYTHFTQACNEYNTCEDLISQKLFIEDTQYDENFKQTIEHIQGCYFVASLIERYNPESIDYFMMNLESFAYNEFVDLPTSKTKKELIEYIHKYTKFMIVDYLVSGKNLEVTQLHQQDNYVKKLQWIILKKAKFYNKNLSEYLKDNVDFINFNYETSLEDSLKELLPQEKELLPQESNIKIKYVYGKIDIKDIEGNPISNIAQDGIWGSIFLQGKIDIKDNEGNPISNIAKDGIVGSIFLQFIRVNRSMYFGNNHIPAPDSYKPINNILDHNILDQCSESITWIGEGKKKELEEKRKEYHKLFKDADEIYFLGFGFDINNLYQLGILDKNGELEQNLKQDQLTKLTKQKKIFISGGNAKIITLLKEKFDIENESSTITGQSTEGVKSKNIGIYRLQNKKYDIRVSPQHLPDALSEDL